ncbi:MAG: ATP-binding protein [Kofleriaceae bacterium]
MSPRTAIRMVLPGALNCRPLAVRVVAEACRLVSNPTAPTDASDLTAPGFDLKHRFDIDFVSAFMEIFNNIAVHSYRRAGDREVEIAIGVSPGELVVELKDYGVPFDLEAVPEPDLDILPEGGMGIHIARNMLDEMVYEPGPPNLWRMIKRISPSQPA